jgi:BlaI family transcriptional regulator, penicillinase repressor
MKLTEAEWQIMNALWQKNPATAREIADRLPTQVNWAYTTIKTMLARLVDKQIVSMSMQGRTSVYEPVVSQNKARQGAFRSLFDQVFDGALGPLVHCLMEEKQLSGKQRQKLIEMLNEEQDPGE